MHSNSQKWRTGGGQTALLSSWCVVSTLSSQKTSQLTLRWKCPHWNVGHLMHLLQWHWAIVNTCCFLCFRWKLTQVSTSTAHVLLSCIAPKDWYVYSHLCEDQLFANLLKEQAQAAQHKELVMLTILTQCTWHYALLCMGRPLHDCQRYNYKVPSYTPTPFDQIQCSWVKRPDCICQAINLVQK